MRDSYYEFERPGSKHICPGCLKKNEFTRYLSFETGEPIADDVGICNNSKKCGYHKTPKQHFRDNPRSYYELPKYVSRSKEDVSFVPDGTLERTLTKYQDNNFI